MPTNDAPTWPGDRGGHVWPKDREVAADDGSRIRFTVRGPEDAPWMVLCAGFMCPDNFWEYIGPLLMERYRVVVLNYRGVGASTDPREPGRRARHVHASDYTVPRFAGDVRAVMDALEIDEAVLLGHSMGCQVALEAWRQDREAADRVSRLVLVTGPYASPLHTFYGSRLGAHLFPFAYLGLPMLPRAAQWAIVRALRLPIAMPVARLIRALGPHTPAAGMERYFQHFGEVDPLIAIKIAKGMHDFDSGPWLSEVDVPTLVVVGGQDTFAPPELGRVMVDLMPHAELVEIEEGTHGALIEFPDEIAEATFDFLDRHARPTATGAEA